MKDKKYYKIITFGCQMNKSDSERVAAVMEHLGYVKAEKVDSSDVVIINACSVRQTAIDRIWGYVRNFELRKNKKELVTVLTGCVLEDDKKKLLDRFDLVFNIKNLFELEKFFHEKQMIGEDYFSVLPKYNSQTQAFVPIMTGCNNYCSYCAVPYVRGRETSRPIKQVLSEVKSLVEKGCVKVTLLGQNVNSYKPSDLSNFNKLNPFKHSFAKLLWEVNQIDGLNRVSFSSAHPKDMDDEVIESLGLPKMLNYLHLALQSGDDRVLENMNRKYTSKDYENIIKKIRQVKPDIALGTDLIVGFPGESEKQFENTVKIYKRIKFDISYNAQYSPRKGTLAAGMKDDVSKAEKKRRWFVLQHLMEDMTYKINQKYKNKIVSVLIDKCENGFCEGNSREMKRVRFKGDNLLMGKIVDVKITKPEMWILDGELI